MSDSKSKPAEKRPTVEEVRISQEAWKTSAAKELACPPKFPTLKS